VPRQFFASYQAAAARAALLDLDRRSRERAQAARERIATYDRPQQSEVDALRAEVAALGAQLDNLRAQDRQRLHACTPADALRTRDEIAGLEETLRAIDAALVALGLPGLERPALPSGEATSGARILPGRTFSALEDCLWLALGARAGLLGETIARADDLLRAAEQLTAWERLVAEDLRDDAIRELTREVLALSATDHERAFLDTLNAYRRTLRLRCVEPDERLMRSARLHSEEMVRLGYFGHVSPVRGRTTPTDRARLEGFAGGVGENCLSGSVDGKGAFEGWYRSPGHHRNMVAEGPLVGVGTAKDHAMWTMVIGAGDLSWRVAHRDVPAARRAAVATHVARLQAEARQRKATPPAEPDAALLPALLRTALPLAYAAGHNDRQLAGELLRLCAALPAQPEQRVLLEMAARVADERLGVALALPPLAERTAVAAQPPLSVPGRGDGPSLSAPLKLVTRAERMRMARQFGGGPRTERMVDRGLAFLARCQDSDGAWRAKSFADVVPGLANRADAGRGDAEWELAMTGLALLCFVTAGNSTEQGEYATQVARGTRFLMAKMLDYGRFETAATHYMYGHAIATQALCEVYAYTADPILGTYAQLAVDWLVDAQHRPSGGWRYEPNERGDTSVLGWVVMALNSAHKAKLSVSGFRDALRFLDSVTEKQYYRVGYFTPTDHGIFGNRLGAVAATSRRFLGQDVRDPRVHWAALRMADDPPDPARADYYYWYYGTLAMFQVGGEPWRKWSEQLVEALAAMQVDKEGSPTDGSFEPDRHYSGTGGRLYGTTLAILCATAWYRYDRAPKTKLSPFTGDIDAALAPYLAILRTPPDDRTLRLTESKLTDDFGHYAVPALLRALTAQPGRDAERRIAALVERLAETTHEGALLKALGACGDGEVRRALMRALERVCTANSARALADALRTDGDPHVRGHAARILGELGGEVATTALGQRLGEERDPGVKERIQAALQRLATRGALDELVGKALGDAAGRPAVRAALAVLERDRFADVLPGLAAAQPKLYRRVVEIVGKEREHAAVPALIALLEADDQSVRTGAFGLLRALTNLDHGFAADGDAAARAEAVRRWNTWWTEQRHPFARDPRARK